MSLPGIELAMLLAGMPCNYGAAVPALPTHDVAPALSTQEPALPIERAEALETSLPASQSGILPEAPPESPTPHVPPPGIEQPVPAIDQSAESPQTQEPVPGIDQNVIVVTGRKGGAPDDPIRQVNAISFAATEAVDKAVLAPAARGYSQVVPRPIRTGVSNFLHNLHEPVVILNYMLQLKPGKAAETLGRFAINSTIGGAGLFDVAKRCPFRLPRHRNGFGDTLGFYGVRPGPYLFLPLIGPTTPRDLVGLLADRMVLPVSVGHLRAFKTLKRYTGPLAVAKVLDHRAEFDEQLQRLRALSANPYVARRDFYLQSRQAEIDGLRGRHSHATDPTSGLDEPHAGASSRPDQYPETPPSNSLCPRPGSN
ncbi:MAG: MlaA family lipoprotein [Allosphingosinicella sp.]